MCVCVCFFLSPPPTPCLSFTMDSRRGENVASKCVTFLLAREITEMLLHGSRFVIPSPLQCTEVQNTQNSKSLNLFCGGLTHGLSGRIIKGV